MKKLSFSIALLFSCQIYAQGAYVNGNRLICPGDELTLFAGGDSSYNWAVSSFPDSILSTSNYITLEPEMNDTIILYSANDTVYTPVWHDPYQCDYHCYVPNIFSPDGDVFNEEFCPILYGIETEGTRLTVANRAGKIVFDETSFYPPCWDGTYDKTGLPVEDGMYVWFFSYIKENGRTENLNGFVILAR